MLSVKYNKETLNLKILAEDKSVHIYQFSSKQSSAEERIELCLPALGMAYHWHPLRGFDSSLKPDWSQSRHISLIESAPVECFYDYRGINMFTVACDELVNDIWFQSGIHEENGSLVIKLTFKNLVVGETMRFYMDTRRIPFYSALAQVSDWWQEKLLLCPVQRKYKKTMYSTWYSYHQNLKEEKLLCDISEIRRHGFSAVILDDGWQTADTGRGYAYCGDWEVTKEKFSDFKEFVNVFHANELAVIVWFSVPYIGEESNQWNMCKSKLLYHDKRRRAGVLDIRYQENIDLIIKKYVDFSKVYQIDGLKLDFLDEFYLRDESPQYNDQMDYQTVSQAVEVLLMQLKQKLLAWRSDFFVEFRQKYIGPAMRQFSNAFRVIDCPYSALSNRVGIMDIRLINGSTPTHSDMLMWHKDETPEGIALQIIACLFGTIQFSVKLHEQTEEQKKVISHFSHFANKNIHLLQESPLHALEPEHQYPHVYVEDDIQAIHVVYAPKRVIAVSDIETTVINGTFEELIYIDSVQDRTAVILDCAGETVSWEKIKIGVNELSVPPGGMALMQVSL